MSLEYENISPDLIWEVTRKNNSFLTKRKQSGGVQFSRDPLNLVNKHSRKYEGYCNAQASSSVSTNNPPHSLTRPQAIGINADDNTVSMITKVSSRQNQPAKMYHNSSFSASTPTRKLYRSVVNSTAKKGYRSDLRAEAVARASAVKQMQKDKKERQAPKLRGAKAKKAAEASS